MRSERVEPATTTKPVAHDNIHSTHERLYRIFNYVFYIYFKNNNDEDNNNKQQR